MEAFLVIARISWRSIWRNRRRTWITVSAITFGLTLAIIFISLGDGAYKQLIDEACRLQGGHLTLEHRDYRDAPSIDLVVSGVAQVRSKLEALDNVKSTKILVVGQGVVKSASGAVGVAIMGVDPTIEAATSPLAHKITNGKYLQEGDRNKVVIGTKLAKNLNLETGKKLVITTSNASGELVEELCRVKGTFELGSDEIDMYTIQIPIEFSRVLFGLDVDEATQIGVMLQDPEKRTIAVEAAKSFAPNSIASRTWEEIMPALAGYIRVDRGGNLIFQGVIIFLSLFTIFNTILMSVLERTRELAIQLALGTSVSQLRLQIIFESSLLGALGSTLGVVSGGALSYWMKMEGLDMSRFIKEGVDVSGFSVNSVIYADVTVNLLVSLWLLVFFSTAMLSLIPGRHISRISVQDVLRK